MPKKIQMSEDELKQHTRLCAWLIANQAVLKVRLPMVDETVKEAAKDLGFPVTPAMLGRAQMATDVTWKGKRPGGQFNSYEFTRALVHFLRDAIPLMREKGINVTMPAILQDWLNAEAGRKAEIAVDRAAGRSS